MADRARARRLAKRIAQIVASELQHRVKDPRLARVTITDAKLTPDLRDATVYYTVLGEEADHSGVTAALSRATGVLRSRVGQQTGVRFTPTLTFVADEVPAQARRMDELLTQAKEADAEVARLAATASPAGEADPYRSEEETDEAETGEVAASEQAQTDRESSQEG